MLYETFSNINLSEPQLLKKVKISLIVQLGSRDLECLWYPTARGGKLDIESHSSCSTAQRPWRIQLQHFSYKTLLDLFLLSSLNCSSLSFLSVHFLY